MNKGLIASALGVIFASAVHAEPGAIITESGFAVTPILNTGLKYDDNIYSRSNSETASTILTIDPSVNFYLEDGVNNYSIDMGLLTAFYQHDSADNFVDGFLGFSTHQEPSSRSRFNFSAEANWTTEPRGTGLTEGVGSAVSEPVRYAHQTIGGTYEYGSMSAFGRVAVSAEYYNKDYVNFKEQTKYRNLEHVKLGSKFIYNTQASSDLFVELTHTDVTYDEQNPNEFGRDSKDLKALVGVEWQATALTSGSAKIGYQKKDFDDAQRENHTGLSWEVGVEWAPLSYSRFEVTTSKAAEEALTEGDYIDKTSFGVAWNHDWSGRLSSSLFADYSEDKYVGVTRNDDELKLGASLNFQVVRWFNVSVFAETTDKNSTNETIYFDKNVVGINTELTL